MTRSDFTSLFSEFFSTYRMVLSLMIPVLLLLKILSYTSFMSYFASFFSPVLSLLHLPEHSSFVLSSTFVANIYSGMITWVSLPELSHLNAAQATTLSFMMLICHSLPVELRVLSKAGYSIWFHLFFRLFCAFLFGGFLAAFFHIFGLFLAPAPILFSGSSASPAFLDWVLSQGTLLLKIGGIILTLMIGMKIFQKLSILSFLESVLEPLFRPLGISKPAISLTVIGLVLGLVYGAALIIKEIQKGTLSSDDVFFSLSFLSICHCIFEDSMLGVLMGGNVWVLVLVRFLLSYIVIFALKKSLLLFQK